MKKLNLILQDIRNGENIEIYLVLLLSLVILILDIFGLVAFDQLLEVMLAIFALISFGMLSIKRALDNNNTISYQVKESMENVQDNLPHQQISSVGISNVYMGPPVDFIDQKMSKAKEKICILETWIPGAAPLQKGMIHAAKSGVHVQILLLNPKSSLAQQRLADQDFHRSTRRPIEAYEVLRASIKKYNLQDQIEVRFYDAIPPFSLQMVDGWLLLGVYWHKHSSLEGPHLELMGRSTDFGAIVVETYKSLWNSATPVATSKSS